jgi:hypothetical protein
MTKSRIALVLLIILAGAGGSEGGHRKPGKYTSERSLHKFAGATRIVLDNFDPMDKQAKSVSLQLDNNEVSFSEFGEQRVTAVFYQAVEAKITLIHEADSKGKHGRIYLIELPKEHAAALGEHTLRLVATAGSASQANGARLLLINREGKVTSALELRHAEN